MARASFGPGMVSGNVDTDIVTGLPRHEHNRFQRDLEKQRHQQQHSNGMRLQALLDSPENQVVLKAMCEELEQRIDLLIANDPPCQALLAVVGRFMGELSLGRRAAEALLDPLYQT